MAEAGLSFGGTGAKVRPVVACKGTTCVYGNLDTQALAASLYERFYVGMRQVSLPHKFKIGVGGCPNSCIKPSLNDFGVEDAARSPMTPKSAAAARCARWRRRAPRARCAWTTARPCSTGTSACCAACAWASAPLAPCPSRPSPSAACMWAEPGARLRAWARGLRARSQPEDLCRPGGKDRAVVPRKRLRQGAPGRRD